MPDKINTTTHNIDVLQKLGFSKIRNTTVFQSNENFIISPSVAENTSGKYWFDLREVNLDRVNSEAILLIRIVPDLFILEPIKSIQDLLQLSVMDCRPNSGNVWGINIKMDIPSGKASLFNVKSPDLVVATSVIEKADIIQKYNEFI